MPRSGGPDRLVRLPFDVAAILEGRDAKADEDVRLASPTLVRSPILLQVYEGYNDKE